MCFAVAISLNNVRNKLMNQILKIKAETDGKKIRAEGPMNHKQGGEETQQQQQQNNRMN